MASTSTHPVLSSVAPSAPSAPASSACCESSLQVSPAGPARPRLSWLDEFRFLLTAKTVLLNAMGVHLLVLFVLFTHYFYIAWVDAIAVDGEDPGPLSNAVTNPNYWLILVVSSVEFALMFLLLWGMVRAGCCGCPREFAAAGPWWIPYCTFI